MSARRRRADALPVPQSVNEARAMLAELGELDAATRQLNENLARAIEHLKARNAMAVSSLNTRADELFLALKTWLEANRNELPKGRKSFKWPEGEMGFRFAQPSLKTSDKTDNVIEKLQKLDRDDLLNIKTTLDKPAILTAIREDKKLATAIGASRHQPEEVFTRPTSAKEARSEKVKAEVRTSK